MGKRLGKIYTRTGDVGTTGLGDGARVSKASARIEAIGEVDELNSWLGLVIEMLVAEGEALSAVTTLLRQCQHRIFDLGGELSIPGLQLILPRHVTAIEVALDSLNRHLAPLENFILPGGSQLVANLHIGRSVCRRAERRVVALASADTVNPEAVKFLNRLSDYLFVAARHCARVGQVQEVLWQKDQEEPKA